MRAAVLSLFLGLFVSPALGEQVDGKAIYEAKCQPCHSVAGQGGKLAHIGGPLDGVGAKLASESLHEYLSDHPKAKGAGPKLPKVQLTPAELAAVAAFVLTLK